MYHKVWYHVGKAENTLNEICQKLNLHLQLDLTPVIGKQNYTVLKWNSESTQNNKQNNWVKYIKDKEAIA